MTDEIIFWIAAGLLCTVAVFALLWALLRKTDKCDAALSQELSRQALAEQLRVLDEERAAGLVTDKIYEASVADVQRRALEELTVPLRTAASVAPWGKAFCLVLAAVVIASALVLYAKLGSPSLINYVSAPVKTGIMQADGSLASTDGLYDETSLAAYLRDNGGDERAWVLYARLKVKEQNWNDAAEAYRKAVALNGLVAKDADVLVEYAAALISQRTQQAYAESLVVLRKALALNDKHLPARELFAISSLELGLWSQARESLEFLLSQIDMNDPVYERLAQAAAYAARQERQHNSKSTEQ